MSALMAVPCEISHFVPAGGHLAMFADLRMRTIKDASFDRIIGRDQRPLTLVAAQLISTVPIVMFGERLIRSHPFLSPRAGAGPRR